MTRSPHQNTPRNNRMKSTSPHSRPEPSTQSDLSQLVERQYQRKSSPRLTDAGRISAAAEHISRSVPNSVSTVRKHKTQESVGKPDKRKSDRKSKDKKDNRGRDKKKAGLTTRSWRAKLAEHFGRNLQECQPIDKPRSYDVYAQIPTTITCSNDFAGEIHDDLTAAL